MRIFENINIDFVGKQKLGYAFSGILLALGILSLLTRGVEMGIDFEGGTSFIVRTEEAVQPEAAREALENALGSTPEVKLFGSEDQLLIRTLPGNADSLQATVVGTLEEVFPGADPTVLSVEVVGPRFAEDLQRAALWSVLGSLLVIFAYVAVRFRWEYSVGAVVCLGHDVLVTLGLFSLLRGIVPFSLQIDQTIIAAFLTIVGYSINDTVVIFDRIREYQNLFKTESFTRIVNRAINSTLSRTVLTGGTTLLALFALFLFGGETLRGFAFALIVGVFFGMYSTVFIASPLMMAIRRRGGKA